MSICDFRTPAYRKHSDVELSLNEHRESLVPQPTLTPAPHTTPDKRSDEASEDEPLHNTALVTRTICSRSTTGIFQSSHCPADALKEKRPSPPWWCSQKEASADIKKKPERRLRREPPNSRSPSQLAAAKTAAPQTTNSRCRRSSSRENANDSTTRGKGSCAG